MLVFLSFHVLEGIQHRRAAQCQAITVPNDTRGFDVGLDLERFDQCERER
jgi:hypothetical protein